MGGGRIIEDIGEEGKERTGPKSTVGLPTWAKEVSAEGHEASERSFQGGESAGPAEGTQS